jgi:hypothetical protein
VGFPILLANSLSNPACLKPTLAEVKRKNSLGNIGKHNGPRNAMYGRNHSQKTKQRISKAMCKLWAERKKGRRE